MIDSTDRGDKITKGYTHTWKKFYPSGIQHFWTMISLPDPLFSNFSSWALISLPVIKFEVWIPPSPLPKLNDLILSPLPNHESIHSAMIWHVQCASCWNLKNYAHVLLSLSKYFTQNFFYFCFVLFKEIKGIFIL